MNAIAKIFCVICKVFLIVLMMASFVDAKTVSIVNGFFHIDGVKVDPYHLSAEDAELLRQYNLAHPEQPQQPTDCFQAYNALPCRSTRMSPDDYQQFFADAPLPLVPKFLTTLMWADLAVSDIEKSYLVLYDGAATWPVLVTLIPEDSGEREIQRYVTIPKGRRVTLDFSSFPELQGKNTNFTLIITIAENKSTATVTTISAPDWTKRQRIQPDSRVETLQGVRFDQ